MRQVFIIILLAISFPFSVLPQDVQVNLRSDSSQILIGNWFPATITVQAPADYRISMPTEDKAFRNAAYVKSDSSVRQRESGTMVYSKEYSLTSFDTGSVSISADITYYKPGDTTAYIATSNDIPMDVVTIRIDTAETYRDIKEVLDVPYTWWDYLLFVSAAIAALMLLWLGWYRWKYRPEKELPEPEHEPEPVIPPEVLALEKLRSLEQKKLWEQGKHKDYQSELSETLREYIEGKFDVPALEETTPEIIGHIALIGVDPALIRDIEVVLQCADLTKFARYIPDPVANRQGLKSAYLFVEETQNFRLSVEDEAKTTEKPIEPAPEEPRPGEPPVEETRSDEDV